MTDMTSMTMRGEHAERELCRLIGAVLTADPAICVPAIAALPGLPPDLHDVGGRAEIVLEIIRREHVYVAEDIAILALKMGLNIATLRLASFMAACMDSPSFQPEEAVQSVVNFALYMNQIRAAETLMARAWAGRRCPELATV